jgi:2-keto-4-pentenoate hydratase/2-oxohepta-3-ene-1,7-dioic acid hydratase in catechol pathway
MVSTQQFSSPTQAVPMQPLPDTADGALLCEPIEGLKAKIRSASKDTVQVAYKDLLAPVPTLPPMVYGLGLNYAAHSAETKMDLPKFPIVIGKAPTSLIGPSRAIEIPKVCSEEVDFEVELAIIIGKQCKNVPKDRALDYVLGFTCANDVSARKWQGKKGGGQWTRAKSFDTFMPVGPGIRLTEPGLNPQSLWLRSHVTKRGSSKPGLMQDANTKEMIFGVATLVEFLSQDTTLQPWTLILTGTPAGVGYTRSPPVMLEPGDTVDVSIEGLGTLSNPVVAAGK